MSVTLLIEGQHVRISMFFHCESKWRWKDTSHVGNRVNNLHEKFRRSATSEFSRRQAAWGWRIHDWLSTSPWKEIEVLIKIRSLQDRLLHRRSWVNREQSQPSICTTTNGVVDYWRKRKRREHGRQEDSNERKTLSGYWRQWLPDTSISGQVLGQAIWQGRFDSSESQHDQDDQLDKGSVRQRNQPLQLKCLIDTHLLEVKAHCRIIRVRTDQAILLQELVQVWQPFKHQCSKRSYRNQEGDWNRARRHSSTNGNDVFPLIVSVRGSLNQRWG